MDINKCIKCRYYDSFLEVVVYTLKKSIWVKVIMNNDQ